MNNIIDRYYELRCEIINTPPIYIFKLKKLFREYEQVKEEMEKQETRGGKRKGSGRKPLPFKTSVIYKRVPEQIKSELIAHIDKEVSKFIKQ